MGKIAIKTIILMIIINMISYYTIYYAIINELRYRNEIIIIIIQSILNYIHFTIIHEAVHGLIVRKSIINDIIGCVSQIWLGPTSYYYAIKEMHLLHHHNTNDKNDPDMWVAKKKYRILRWLTIDLNYWMLYIKRIIERGDKKSIIKLAINKIIIATIINIIYKNNCTIKMIKHWIIPSRIALFMLVFIFDYIPHKPHNFTRKQNIYKTTKMITTYKILEPLLKILMIYQNYHIIHHINPNIPFYEYPNYWKKNKKELENKIEEKKLIIIR